MKKYLSKFLIGIFLLSCSFSATAINHSSFSVLLNKYVTVDGKVNYKGIINEKDKLNDYLALLESNVPQQGWSKNEKLAYWINAYNAFTIKLIIDNYPLKSIMKINNGKPWDLRFITLGNTKYTLNEIENNILRKQFKDPRIHFSINCASISCPKLLNKAYEAESVNKQLNKNITSFLNNPSKNNISPSVIAVSKIFDWFKDDFKSAGGVISFINKYSDVKVDAEAKITYKEYNWNLNN